MRKMGHVLVLVLILMLMAAGAASAETVNETDAGACITRGDGSGNIYFTSLQEALGAVQEGDTVSVLKDAEVTPDFIPDVGCKIIGEGLEGKKIVISGGNAPRVVLKHSGMEFYKIHFSTQNGEPNLTISLDGCAAVFGGCSIDGTIHGENRNSVLTVEKSGLAAERITGYGRLRVLNTTLNVESAEASAVEMDMATLNCTAEVFYGPVITIHNAVYETGSEAFQVKNLTFSCSEAARTALAQNTGNPEISLLKFDYPVADSAVSLANIMIPQNVLGVDEPEGMLRMLFGHGAAAAQQLYDEYRIQHAAPVSFACDTSGLERRLYCIGETFLVKGTYGITTTYTADGHYYTRNEITGFHSSYPCVTNRTIVSSVKAGSTVPAGTKAVVLEWTPVNGFSQTLEFVKVSDAIVSVKPNALFPYGPYASISFDEAATDSLGTVYYYEGNGTIRTSPDGILVMKITPFKGYKMTEIRGQNCTVTPFGPNQYAVTGFTAGKERKLLAEFEAAKISYTLEWPNRNGYVDYDEGRQKLMIGTDPGYQIKDVVVNGISLGPVTEVQLHDGDDVKVYFAKIGGEDGKDSSDSSSTSAGAASKEKLIAGVKATTIKASSVNVVGTKIRVVWKKSPGYKVDYYQIFRSTKRNSGYGTKPIYTTKTGKATSYTNSKNLKVGTRYYYKVRGVRVIDGKKYYTKWSNKANRTAIYTPQASGKY